MAFHPWTKSGTSKDLIFYCGSNRVKRLEGVSFSAMIKFIELENLCVESNLM